LNELIKNVRRSQGKSSIRDSEMTETDVRDWEIRKYD